MPERMKVTSYEVDADFDLAATLGRREGFLWSRGGEGRVAWGEHLRVAVPSGPDRFEGLSAALDDAFGRLDIPSGAPGQPIAYGSFTFDHSSPGSVLVIPNTVISKGAGKAVVTLIGDEPEPELVPAGNLDRHDFKIRYAGSSVDELAWLEAVALAVKEIGTRAMDKVVLARDVKVWTKEDLDLSVVLGRLARSFPECYTFACESFVGATPELLISRYGDNIRSLVLAGTAPRSDDEVVDSSIGDALAGSAKDMSEHTPAVASVLDRLGPLTSEISASAEPFVLKLRNLQHLATEVRGRLERPVHVLDLVAALHPTAAVCGDPTDAAFDTIRRLEGMDRSRYAGPVGWTNAAGEGEWGIALRCAEFSGNRGRLFAGGGFVRDSEPEAELEETSIKLRAVQAALEGV